jgi:hypothetical protein
MNKPFEKVSAPGWNDGGRTWATDNTSSSSPACSAAKTCRWAMDDDGTWHTSCANAFQFECGNPEDNDFAYCPYCGGKISG